MQKKTYLMLLTIPAVLILLVCGDVNNYKKHFKEQYQVFAVPLPDSLYFSGEKVPLHRTDVLEAFDRELLINTYWQSQTLLFIKRAHKYFPLIEPILSTYQVPNDFKYLCVIESGLTNAVSPAGAVGYWQFLEGTASDYDLEITETVDERYHLKKSTEAAARYLSDSYKKYGNWTLVAASYNTGRSGLDTQIERQNENNYYNLELADETMRYIYRILAVKTILENPVDYGFHFRKTDLYTNDSLRYIETDTTISNLSEFAHKHNISYRQLKYYNPWLRENELLNTDNKTYLIAVPYQKKH